MCCLTQGMKTISWVHVQVMLRSIGAALGRVACSRAAGTTWHVSAPKTWRRASSGISLYILRCTYTVLLDTGEEQSGLCKVPVHCMCCGEGCPLDLQGKLPFRLPKARTRKQWKAEYRTENYLLKSFGIREFRCGRRRVSWMNRTDGAPKNKILPGP